MIAKHTPGPWDWFTDAPPLTTDLTSKARTPGARVQARYLVGANGQGFAHTVGLPHEQDEANARLIAAAPELLEALQMMRDPGRLEDSAWYREALDKADAAIAKATGGAP
jgi:hypothetical protein